MEKTALGHTLMITGSPVHNSRRELIQIVINIRDLSEVAELRQELMKTQELVADFEKTVIKKTIAECGSTHKGAKALGISPSTLFRKLKE
ncbi:MAG: hypothetical protein GX750_04720 [Clostridia bacterium]|nr:hypothetical protein [Clostridia bacterium]